MDVTLQKIFTESFSVYARGKSLPYKHYKAANAIINCRIPYLGGYDYACEEGHEHHPHYHSCKHRSCPLCNALPKAQWIERQKARLLTCDHYHVIFTLPHELLALWCFNARWLSDNLFQSCRDTLMTLLQDERHLGAAQYPDVAAHVGPQFEPPPAYALPGEGGLEKTGHWRPMRYDYLLPLAVMRAVFKGKLLARLWDGLTAGELTIPPYMDRGDIQRLLRKLNEKKWNVHIRERYRHGRGVMPYLARYVKGGAITNQRIMAATAKQVKIQYKDHRDEQHKTMVLRRHDFMERVLWHLPETGQHTVWQYGLYAHQARLRRNQCRAELGQAPEQTTQGALGWRQFLDSVGQKTKTHCSKCGKALLRWTIINPVERDNENSIYIKYHGRKQVQQDDQLEPAPDFVPIQGPT